MAKKPIVTQIVEANTTDADNSGIVAKYRLAGAPLTRNPC